MTGNRSMHPRDVDIVVDHGVSNEALAAVFRQFIVRRTRFGGLNLRVGNTVFDIWSLSETWALRQHGFKCSFSELPKTTFLNVEAVVAELAGRPGQRRNIYSSGFFEAAAHRLIEINFEPNPFPALCVVRSLITTARLDWAVGPNLARYLVDAYSRMPLGAFERAQLEHYGIIRCGANEIREWIESIREQTSSPSRNRITLPISKERQRQLWEDWPSEAAENAKVGQWDHRLRRDFSSTNQIARPVVR